MSTNPYEIVTHDGRLRFIRDLEELQTDLLRATSANSYCWIKKGNITMRLAKGSKKVLDVGCGWGRELIRLKDAIGVDVCLPFLKTAKYYTRKEVIRASADRLPFRESFFDLIVMSEVIEHLKNPMKAMNESVRVLEPKGKIILQTPNYHLTKQRIIDRKYGHVHEFSSKEIFELLSKFGFHKLKQLGSTIPYIPSCSRLVRFDRNKAVFRLWRLLDKLFHVKWDLIIFAELDR